MKLTIRKSLIGLSFIGTILGTGTTGAYPIKISTLINAPLTAAFEKLSPYLPTEIQHKIAAFEFSLLIKEFLNPENNKPLKIFFEQTINFIKKNRSFVKSILKPNLNDETKEAVVDSLIRNLNAHKTGTSLKWIALSFYPLSYKYFLDKRHPFIEQHLDQLKYQLSRRIELNKNL